MGEGYYEAKYNRNDTMYHIPCGLSEEEETHLQALSLAAFKAVDAKGWGRIDAMQDENGLHEGGGAPAAGRKCKTIRTLLWASILPRFRILG